MAGRAGAEASHKARCWLRHSSTLPGYGLRRAMGRQREIECRRVVLIDGHTLRQVVCPSAWSRRQLVAVNELRSKRGGMRRRELTRECGRPVGRAGSASGKLPRRRHHWWNAEPFKLFLQLAAHSWPTSPA